MYSQIKPNKNYQSKLIFGKGHSYLRVAQAIILQNDTGTKKASIQKWVSKIKQNHLQNTRKVQKKSKQKKKVQRAQLMAKTNKPWGGSVGETSPVLAKLWLKPAKVLPPLFLLGTSPPLDPSNSGKQNFMFKNKHPFSVQLCFFCMPQSYRPSS